MELSFTSLINRISESHSILLVSHNRPDGDAIGSLMGLGLLLEGTGKTVRMVNADAVPEGLTFLPGSERVEQPDTAGSSEHDLMISLDSAGLDRISDSVWGLRNGVDLINIDHHISNSDYGDMNYVDSGSPATGQIVFQLAEKAGWSITAEIAGNLYGAISTDTGSFRYPSTSAETYRIVTELVRAGVNVGEINRQLYDSFPLRRVEVMREMLNGLRIEAEGRCASVRLPLSVTEELGLQAGDTEGVVDVIRGIDSVIIAVLFEELPDGKIRVSSRSKEERYGVGDICNVFGGGGHTLAAGARLPGPLGEAEDRFLAEVILLLGDK
ncbi:bifunctional oligoribonuclease/PAP phosphatase NrnA [Verrucomicrobiales bacterium]|nr:bifunctional oligoribonuclease/PAP phosphatase NrnA [Verrucomicrobiales bacterium]|tara:strand:- start:243 stop:1220 length:978 start_codon:yes stop_codon:yes gene_type:complete